MDSENPRKPQDTTTPDDRILMWCNCCGQKYRLRKELAGKTGTCDECHNDFLIPLVSQTKPELKKTISFRCEHCNKKLLKPEELAGKEVSCHGCGKRTTVPEDIEEEHSPTDLLEPYIVAETTRTDLKVAIPSSSAESTEEEKILFWCNCCGQKYRLPRSLVGKSGVCSRCKNFLFIPAKSQTKPELKKTISFPCEHCGKKQIKPKELAGTETTCYHCSEKYIVPAKSRKSLVQIVNPISLLEPFLVAETTRTDIPVPDDKILFWCSHCGQKYRLPHNLSGKAGICTKCQNYLFIPHVSQTKPKLEWSVVFPCKYCGQKIRKSRKLAGSEVKCKHCSRKVLVPAKSQISILPKKGADPEERILFWCSYCGQKYRLPEHLAGKTGTCDNCQKRFVIPEKSQTKPELKKTIIFSCADCGKTLWEEEDLIGVEVQCSRCGEGNIVPEESDNSLARQSKTEVPSESPVIPESMPGDPMPVGLSTELRIMAKAEVKATIKAQRAVSAKATSKSDTVLKAEAAAKAAIAKTETSKIRNVPSKKTKIVITDNPPTIHKLKHYFHEKAEKYFIFAMFIVVIDYILDRCEAGHRPSKAFVLVCTFAAAAIILIGTWNFVMAKDSDKIINSRYNITCSKCGFNEIRRFKNISGQRCTKCNNSVAYTYKCNKCNKSFPYSKAKSKKENAKEDSDTARCPFCHSDDIHYVIPKKFSPGKK